MSTPGNLDIRKEFLYEAWTLVSETGQNMSSFTYNTASKHNQYNWTIAMLEKYKNIADLIDCLANNTLNIIDSEKLKNIATSLLEKSKLKKSQEAKKTQLVFQTKKPPEIKAQNKVHSAPTAELKERHKKSETSVLENSKLKELQEVNNPQQASQEQQDSSPDKINNGVGLNKPPETNFQNKSHPGTDSKIHTSGEGSSEKDLGGKKSGDKEKSVVTWQKMMRRQEKRKQDGLEAAWESTEWKKLDNDLKDDINYVREKLDRSIVQKAKNKLAYAIFLRGFVKALPLRLFHWVEARKDGDTIRFILRIEEIDGSYGPSAYYTDKWFYDLETEEVYNSARRRTKPPAQDNVVRSMKRKRRREPS